MKLLVICARRYNGHELWTALGTFKERGHSFEVVSQALEVRDELTLQPNSLARLVYDVAPEEVATYDGVVVVSGNMQDTEAYWTDPHVESLLRAAQKERKTIAAICCSVPTLAPIAKGVEVSFFPLIRSKQRLREAGAILRSVALTVDSRAKIATAEHQMATQMWAEEICNLIEGKPPQYNLKDSGYVPKGRPRRLPADVQRIIDADKAKAE